MPKVSDSNWLIKQYKCWQIFNIILKGQLRERSQKSSENSAVFSSGVLLFIMHRHYININPKQQSPLISYNIISWIIRRTIGICSWSGYHLKTTRTIFWPHELHTEILQIVILWKYKFPTLVKIFELYCTQIPSDIPYSIFCKIYTAAQVTIQFQLVHIH